MSDYSKHYQHIQRLVSLTIAPELPDAVAAVVLLDHLSALAAEAALPTAAVTALDPAPVPVFQPRDIIAMALQAEEPPNLGRLHALLERRFEEHRQRRAGEDAGVPARAVRDSMPAPGPAHAAVWAGLDRYLVAARDRLTVRQQEAGALAEQASQSFDSSHREAETQLANYRRAAAPRAEATWRKILRAGGVWWIVPVLLTAMLYLIGQPALRATFAGFAAAAAVAFWARRLGDAGANPAAALARVTPRLCAPAAEALATWFEMREETTGAATGVERLTAIRNLLGPELKAGTAITANLARIRRILVQHLEQVPEGPLEEPRPGLVRVTGAEVARALAAAGANLSSPDLSQVPSGEIPAAELMPAARALLAQIRSQLPEVAVPAALAAVESLAGGRLLVEQYLRMLAASAISAARLKPGARLDRGLCPEMLSIGLPEGASSPLVPLVARLFPQAPIMAAFRPGRLEILYDIANASRDQLRITEMAESAYSQATALERQLWHLPRRYRGLQSEPQPDLRAV